MNFGKIKKIYELYQADKQVLEKIQINLEKKNVDKMEIADNAIYFSNSFIGNRSNLSLMSGIDSGYFKLIETNNSKQLIVMFSIKRILLFWAIIATIIFIVNSGNLIISFTISLFMLIGIIVSILRYKAFVSNIIKEFQVY